MTCVLLLLLAIGGLCLVGLVAVLAYAIWNINTQINADEK